MICQPVTWRNDMLGLHNSSYTTRWETHARRGSADGYVHSCNSCNHPNQQPQDMVGMTSKHLRFIQQVRAIDQYLSRCKRGGVDRKAALRYIVIPLCVHRKKQKGGFKCHP